MAAHTLSEPFENALLGLIFGGPKHGYELMAFFGPGGELYPVGRLAKSQLYALLKALGDGGYATVEEGQGGHGPTRKVWSITPRGRERFLAWVRTPEKSIRGLRVGFLLRLHFIRALGLGGQAELMDRQAEVLSARLAELKAIGEGDRGGIGPWVHALQTDLLESGIAWLRSWRDRNPVGDKS